MLLEFMKAKNLLGKYGIRSIESKYVATAYEAVSFADGNAIVLKALSDKAIHKSKAGLVKLNLKGEGEIRHAFSMLEKRANKFKPYRILAQKMAEPGVEGIIGGNTDAQFGKVLLLGLGGIYVEAFNDVQLRLCPITKRDALDMINGLRSRDILTSNGKSTDMLVSLLMKTSRLLVENKRIKELDLNPVILRDGSYDVVDIRVLV